MTGTIAGLNSHVKSTPASAWVTQRFTVPKLHGNGMCACCGNDARFAGSGKPVSSRRANTSNGFGCGLMFLVALAVGLYWALSGGKGKKSSGGGSDSEGGYIPVDTDGWGGHGHDGGDYGGGDAGGDCG